MKNVPKKIFLQLGDLTKEELKNCDFEDLRINGQITWHDERIDNSDIEYTLTLKQ